MALLSSVCGTRKRARTERGGAAAATIHPRRAFQTPKLYSTEKLYATSPARLMVSEHRSETDLCRVTQLGCPFTRGIQITKGGLSAYQERRSQLCRSHSLARLDNQQLPNPRLAQSRFGSRRNKSLWGRRAFWADLCHMIHCVSR